MRARSELCPPPPHTCSPGFQDLLLYLVRQCSPISSSVGSHPPAPQTHADLDDLDNFFFLKIKRTLQASAVRDTFFPVPELKCTASSGPDPVRP